MSARVCLDFLAGAAASPDEERHWLGLGTVTVAPPHYAVAVHDLVELPGLRARAGIVAFPPTRDAESVCRQLRRLVGRGPGCERAQ